MKVTVERLPQSSIALDIVAESDEFSKAMDRAFRKISRQVRIPGFRPGRAPRQIVEQRVGRQYLVEEAQREIMDDLYRQALEQEEITPVSEPNVDVYQEEPVAFKVEVQVYPTVDLNEYTAVRVEPKEVEVTVEEVEDVLKDLQKQHSIWKEPESPRKPIDGDQIIMDLQAYEGDEPYQDPVVDAEFELGEGRLFPEIEEAMKQLSPGEQAEFDITFGEEDENINPDLHGKTLHYKVTLKEVKEREMPQIDDELAKTAGEYETLDELRAAIRKDLLRNKAVQARTDVVNDAINSLADQASLDVPSAMVDRQIEDDLQRLRQELSRDNMSMDEFLRFGGKTLDEYKDEIRPDAERRMRNSLVLESFAKTEGIEVTEDDLAAEVDRLIGSSSDAQQMRDIYSSPYFANMIRDELANRKVADRLIEIVTEGVGAVTGEGAEALQEPAVATESVEIEGEAASEDDSGEPSAEAEQGQTAEIAAAEIDATEAPDAQPNDAGESDDATPTQAATESDDDESDEEGPAST